MKKITSVILLTVFLLAVCSCGAVPDKDELSSALLSPYKATALINDGGDVYTADISLDEKGVLSLCISEPALLCGVSYGFTGDESYVVYNDLMIPLDEEKAAGRFSKGVLVWKDMLSPDGDYSVRSVADKQKKQYVMTDGKTEYRFDGDKKPVLIKNGDITITISDFRIKNDKASESIGADIESGA